LRLTSRLTVEADRPKWRAIDRNERRMLSHREISSFRKTERLLAPGADPVAECHR
jgi:hypothetical protein